MKILNDHLPPEQLAEVRRGNREAMVEFLSSDTASALCVIAIEGHDCPHSTALMLAHEPSATLYDFMSTLTLILNWAAQGGAETVRAERLNNDSLDMYYLAIALYCSDLKTKDRRLKHLYDIVKEALDRRWSVNRARFASMGML